MDPLNRTMLMMEAAHQAIHDKEQDFDDTLFVAMTERDALLIGLGMATLWFMYPCLLEDSRELQLRMLELAKAQKPDWVVRGEDGED